MQQNEVNYQLVPRTSMDKTQQNEPSDVLNTTSSWVLAAQTKTGPCISGADFYHNAQQLSTYYAARRSSCSQINPQLSAYTQLNGAFDFNKTPLALPGTRVIIHEKSSVCQTWAPHGVDGWYIGPAPEHYRCYKLYCSKTGHECITDTI